MNLFNNRNSELISGADISECGLYRYSLHRIWDLDKDRLLFIMLNPSTADANQDDPTIRRCIGFAKKFGFGGIEVRNLFAYRTPSPEELLNAHKDGIDIIGNNPVLNVVKSNKITVVAAWGNIEKVTKSPRLNSHVASVRNLYAHNQKPLYCLGRTKNGDPRHPLYLPLDSELQSFNGLFKEQDYLDFCE